MQALFEFFLPLLILQTMVAIAVVFLCRTLARRFPEAHFLSYWGWAWAAYAGYLLFGGASVQLSKLRWLSEVLALASMLAGFVQAALLVLGAERSRQPVAAAKHRGHWGIVVAAIVALVVFFLSMLQPGDRVAVRLAARQPLVGAAFFYCAAAFYQRARRKGSRSALVVTTACASYGIVYLLLGAAYAVAVQTPRLQPMLFLIYVDLVCQFAIAAGIILQLDEEYQLQQSRRARLEEQLRQAQKMEAVGQLAGGVAHDFNNLLTVIRGHVDALRAGGELLDPQQHHLDEINRTADQASSLTRQLLAFSRKQVLQPKLLELNSVVAEMVQMLRRLMGKHIELEIVADAQVGRVKADRSQMEQILMNLAVNARDAMSAGGRLSIRTTNAEIGADQAPLQADIQVPIGRYVLLEISDTGIGMDRLTQAHMFEPFFTTKEPTKGTGLGLATVYGIVKQSGGWIGVESEPGRGTTFKIFLPQVVAPGDAVEPKERIVASSPPPLSGSETILLVEDERGIRELAGKFLTNNGYTVLAAGNGAEALDLARHHAGPVDLLVTDMVMPKLDGRELVRLLTQSLPHMKVLLISGYSHQTGRETGLGETAYLSKPFSMEQLVRKVREVLDRPR